MNLHLYIPPKSAHPKGVLKSLIFGSLQRFWLQNSDKSDYMTTAAAFFGHLLNRGYTPTELTPIFEEAAASIDHKEASTWRSVSRSSTNSIFIHWEFHPRDIGRKAIRQTFHQILAPVLAEHGSPTQPTVAFSVPPNIGNCVRKTQMKEPNGQRVSSFIEFLDNNTSQPLS